MVYKRCLYDEDEMQVKYVEFALAGMIVFVIPSKTCGWLSYMAFLGGIYIATRINRPPKVRKVPSPVTVTSIPASQVIHTKKGDLHMSNDHFLGSLIDSEQVLFKGP